VQLIPVHTVPAEADYVLRSSDNCDRYLQAKKALAVTPEWVAKEKASSEVLDLVAEFWEEEVALDSIGHYSDMLVCEEAHGFDDTRMFPKERWRDVKDLYDWVVSKRFSPGLMGRYSGGALLAQWKRDLMDAVNGVNSLKAKIYSAHDSTVNALLAALGIQPDGMPAYASYIELELQRDESGVLYLAWSMNGDELPLPGCPAPCHIHDYFDATAEMTVEEPMAECHVEEEDRQSYESSMDGVLDPNLVDPNSDDGAELPYEFDWSQYYWLIAVGMALSGVCCAGCFLFSRASKRLVTAQVSMDAADVELELMEESVSPSSSFVIDDEDDQAWIDSKRD